MNSQKTKTSLLEECRQKLTIQRQKFCEEYIVDGNGKRSALKAGYSEKTAVQQATTILKQPNVKAYIEQLRLKQQHRTDADADRVVEEMAKMAFSNIKNYYDDKGSLRNLRDLDDDIAAAIHSIKETEFKGKDDTVKVVREFKLYDKLGALRELGQHFDIYNTEKSKEVQQVEINIKINRNKKSDNKES